MSGGHFNGSRYVYHQVSQFADELEHEIDHNNVEEGCDCAPEFSEETLSYLRQKVSEIRKIAEDMRHIDYLYSGDHGEESFMKIMKESK